MYTSLKNYDHKIKPYNAVQRHHMSVTVGRFDGYCETCGLNLFDLWYFKSLR